MKKLTKQQKLLNDLKELLYNNVDEIIYKEELKIDFYNTKLYIYLDNIHFIMNFVKDMKDNYKLYIPKNEVSISRIIEIYERWFNDNKYIFNKIFYK